MNRSIVIFDVCNTIYDSNTTFDFIAYVLHRQHPLRYEYFKWLTRQWSPLFWLALILCKVLNKDIIRIRCVKLLRGISKAELNEWAEKFYNQHLLKRQVPEVCRLLTKAKQSNEVWLFSNSIEPVVQVIAYHLDAKYEATQIEYDMHENFTGNIVLDLAGRKQEIFEQRFGKDVQLKMMCSDNKSDADILKCAERPFVVIYKKADKKFWRKLNPTFIEKL